MADEFSDKPLTLKEVAHQLHVSTRTVQRWIKERWFPPPAFMPGGGKVWFARDLEAFLYLVRRGLYNPSEVEDIPEEAEE